MNRAGHKLLARSALAANKHRFVRRGNLRYALAQCSHSEAGAEQSRSTNPRQTLIFRSAGAVCFVQPAAITGSRDRLLQSNSIERLLNVIERTQAHRFDGG